MTDADTHGVHLTVTGTLLGDGELRLSPGFQTTFPHYGDEPSESPLLLEQLAADGSVLLARAVAVTYICTPGTATDARAVVGKVPFHADTRALRFVLEGREILRVDVPDAQPVVRLTWEPKETVDGREKITWEGSHAGGAPLHYLVLYSPDGEWWQPLSLPLPESGIEVDFAALPGGDARIAILATDGVNTTRVESRVFRMPVKPCLATVLAPVGEAPATAGHAILLVGQGYYMEERRPELEALSWSSSLDGELGTGGMLDAKLSPGRHTITLTAGSGGRAGTATTIVLVDTSTTVGSS